MNERPKRAIRGDRTRGTRARMLAAAASIVSLALVGTVGAAGAMAAPRADYPSWSDVQKAKRSEAAAKSQLAKINRQLAQSKILVERTQRDAEMKGNAFAEAQMAYDEQAIITENIQAQHDAAQAEADKAKSESTKLITNLAKQGGGDMTATMLGDSDGAAGYLYRIGAMQKVSERSDAVYQRALRLQNTAKGLAEQAKVAEEKLDELKKDAERKFKIAQAAAAEAADQLAAQEEAKAKAESLVAFLKGKRQKTEADYKKGLQEKWGSGAGGEVSASGWARPATGYISSNFGNRYHPIYKVWKLHSGVDLAGQGCGAPIHAAHAGVVTYAGWYSDLGNYVVIDHLNGTTTGYAHIQEGGIGVRVGQEVGPGQKIAKVGTTGGSTGCHLHFMVRVNGNLTDPVPFMRARGITLG